MESLIEVLNKINVYGIANWGAECVVDSVIEVC